MRRNMALQLLDRHAKYYFEDGNVVFLTNEKTLFRLHKSLLKLHSVFFEDLFQLKQPDTQAEDGKRLPLEGDSDSNPITADVQNAEFESICKALYEMPLTSPSELSVDQAISLLRVSTKFQFEVIHDKVVNNLNDATLSPWMRHALAVDCLVDSWIVRSYIEICSSVDYHSAEVVAEFTQRNEDGKLSRILELREEYRTKLLLYAHGSESFPYPKLNPPASSLCSNCLTYLKQILVQVLSGNTTAYVDEATANQTPLLYERVAEVIKSPSSPGANMCANCRSNEKSTINQILGVEELEIEVRKAMHLTSKAKELP